MSSPAENTIPAPPKRKRRWLRWLATVVIVLAGISAALVLYLNSDSFRETVRARVVADLERMTGGKVEIESFTWKLSTLQFEIHNLTIHGREAANEVPYAHADRITVAVKIVSFFSRKISLEKVNVEGSTFHLIIFPDGSTNQPSPASAVRGDEAAPQGLFDLAIKEIAVNDGVFMLNQERVPFNLAGKDVSAGMSYVDADRSYDGHLDLAPITIAYRGASPFQAEVHGNFRLRNKETEIKSLKLATRQSSFEGSGTLRHYDNPELALDYQASLDLAEVAREGKVPQLRGGHAELKGKLSYQSKRYSSQGNVNVHDLDWRDSTVRLAGLDADSPYALTPEKIVLSRLQARIFGGSVQGDLQIANWNPPPAGKKSPPQRSEEHTS